MRIDAPWTDAQVAALNQWQTRGDVHPFTCGGRDCRASLIAYSFGWRCPLCSYEQTWAHDFMARSEEERR